MDDYLRPTMAMVAKASKVDHYTLLDFGKGPAHVAAMVAKKPPTSGAYVIDTRSPASAAVLEVLRPLAHVLIQGT
jgi:hypothetical protein